MGTPYIHSRIAAELC